MAELFFKNLEEKKLPISLLTISTFKSTLSQLILHCDVSTHRGEDKWLRYAE